MSSERRIEPLSWRFGQCFGEKESDEDFAEADVLSAVEFDYTGNYLATGDKGGRIVLFERADISKAELEAQASKVAGRAAELDGSMDHTPVARSGAGVEYRFYTEFQSHEAEFDYLKSLEIEEKINKIAWCRPSNSSLMLLSTNDKTVKLWKVFEKQLKVVSQLNCDTLASRQPSSASDLHMPRLVSAQPTICATPRRTYANAHAYHINSISISSDGELFLSSDDLRVNLWHLDRQEVSFTMTDVKPENLSDLTEVVTSAKFHPTSCFQMAYSTSRGAIKLADMRAASTCDAPSLVMEAFVPVEDRNYFTEIVASVSDLCFTRDGKYIITRDYCTVKFWDVAMPREPVRSITVQNFPEPKLHELYEGEYVFDKFGVAVSGSGEHIMTGSYSNLTSVFDANGETETTIELSKVRPRPAVTRPASADNPPIVPFDRMDTIHKVMHYSWHPQLNVAAVAGLNNLYIYTA